MREIFVSDMNWVILGPSSSLAKSLGKLVSAGELPVRIHCGRKKFLLTKEPVETDTYACVRINEEICYLVYEKKYPRT